MIFFLISAWASNMAFAKLEDYYICQEDVGKAITAALCSIRIN